MGATVISDVIEASRVPNRGHGLLLHLIRLN